MKLIGIAFTLALVASCSKSKDTPATGSAGSAGSAGSTGSAGSAGSAGSTGSAGSAGSAGSGTASGSGSATATAAGSGSATAAGSGSGSAPASGSDVGSGSGSATASGSGSGSAAFDFDKLTYDEKRDFMRNHVVPTMKPMFQKFDGKKYAAFGCKTCHGKDPQGKKYKMPSADLPKLDFAAIQAGKQEPETAKFMAETVKPEMAKLLQQPEMTETTDGFGCLECHQQKK